MTYFGHFKLLFLNLKLRCPGIRKDQETYVAGGVQRISIFWETAQGLLVQYRYTLMAYISSNKCALYCL